MGPKEQHTLFPNEQVEQDVTGVTAGERYPPGGEKQVDEAPDGEQRQEAMGGGTMPNPAFDGLADGKEKAANDGLRGVEVRQ